MSMAENRIHVKAHARRIAACHSNCERCKNPDVHQKHTLGRLEFELKSQ